MPTVFTRIIAGELPAHRIHEDDRCVVILSINPLTDGHALVVPRVEVDHWLDLDAADLQHITAVAQRIGRAQMAAFTPTRVATMVVGFEVPHMHIHVVPVNSMADCEFGRAAASVPDEQLASAAKRLRTALAAEAV